eukprot:TRINITY_DN32149_c0_g1_i1.p1 TRINITY_DN32149_c0_g1~~TRINITY_DN32149_c0_g1_i1.p1  ORF type:complete len:792 (+),score=185.56 TRINITY_DN32149_c0_g1_i1:69-2444(+)
MAAADPVLDGNGERRAVADTPIVGLPPAKAGDVQKLVESGDLSKKCLVAGTGETPQVGSTVKLLYKGYLDREGGEVFDVTKPEDPLIFEVGCGMVIRGIDLGVQSMRVGEKSILTVGPTYGHGDTALADAHSKSIPGSSVLVFEIELLASDVLTATQPFGHTPRRGSGGRMLQSPARSHGWAMSPTAQSAFGAFMQTDGGTTAYAESAPRRGSLEEGQAQPMTGLSPGAFETARGDWKLPYEETMWTVFLTITALLIIDRFWLQVWPRQAFGKGYGTDFIGSGLRTGPWSVKLYDFIARISARVAISSTTALYLTSCHNFMTWWAERTKHFQMEGWQEANLRLHRGAGWLLALTIVPHVWTVFAPAVFSGWKTIEFPGGAFQCCPASKRGVGFFDLENEIVSLDGDDTWRLVAMTLIFCIFIPISVSTWARNASWTGCTYLHLIVTTIFFLDLIRRQSHPHCWILNIPPFLFWVGDKIYGSIFCAAEQCVLTRKVKLDDNYMVLFWRRQGEQRKVSRTGDVFKLSLPGDILDVPHPFTTMSNHRGHLSCPLETRPSWIGHKFVLVRGADTGVEYDFIRRQPTLQEIEYHRTLRDAKQKSYQDIENEEGGDAFDIAAIVRVCPGGFTQRLCEKDQDAVMLSTGPFRSSYSLLDQAPFLPPLVLAASGAGGAYLMDFVGRLRADSVVLANPVCIYYTVRSLPLLQFVTDHLCTPPVRGLSVHAALTSASDIHYEGCHETRDIQIGRLNIDQIIAGAPKDAHVYFCGAPKLQGWLEDIAAKAGLRMHTGHSFGE